MLHQQISLLQGSAVDAEARIFLQALPSSKIQTIDGQLCGPHCEFARTLPATFAAQPAANQPGAACLTELFVPDPCFWTPGLPFLYDLKLSVTTEGGETLDYETSIALKRWSVDGGNWKLEGRRVVLRGAVSLALTDETLAAARATESMLIVASPGETVLESASRRGVPLMIDLRETGENELERLAWSPAVVGAIFSSEQLRTQPLLAASRSGRFPVGVVVDVDSQASDTANIPCNFFVVELCTDQRPPGWLASAEKPVIVIRQGAKQADLATARAACDRLQAELAPEFDLAGYFVAS